MNIKQYIKANGCTEEEAQGLLKADPCALCYLNKNPYGRDVKGWGSTTPTFMVVSDYIRKGWISTGFKSFCGPLYTLLNKMMTEVGIDQKDVYYTSLVKCPTATSLKKGEDGKLKKEAVDYCSCKLEQEITQLKPKVIIACGQDALSYFFPNYKMAEKRCQILNDPKHNCVVIPIYNPEIMVTTAEFDRIIQKAFEQAYNYLYNKQKLACTEKLNYKRVTSLEMLKAVLNRVKEVEAFAYDVEASSLNPMEAKLLSIGISWKVNTGVAFPIYIVDSKEINKRLSLASAEIDKAKTTEEKKKAKESFNKLEKEIGANPPLISFWGDHHAEVMDIVKQIFDAPCKKGGHNIDYDNKVLYYNGIEVNHVTFDTMLMHHMLDEERPKDLDYLSWVDTDKGGYKMAKEEYLDTIKKSYAHIPLDVLLDYNAGDADTTFELYLKYKPLLIQEGMAKEFATVRMPLLVELINVSITGMKIDRNYIDTVRVELLNKISDCENKLKEFLKSFYPNVKIIQDSKEKGSEAGVTYFNIKSSADLSDLIYNKMKVKATILTESGKPSTNEAALIKLSKKYPILSAILEHRKNTKFYDTYIKDMPSYMDKDDRVHANFKIATAVTGRMSVTDPALQTIPRDSTVKKMFVPEKGYGIMEVDFSQQELRCLAYLSNDTAMCRAYSQGKDLHMELAKSIFNKEEQDVTKEERTMAKCCNFLQAYGGGPSVLCENLEKMGVVISEAKARKIIDGWNKKFSGAVTFLNSQVNFFINHGYLQTPAGLKKHLYRVFTDNYIMEGKKRQARNFPIQAYCSSITFYSLLTIIRKLREQGLKSRVISTVHDSILIEVKFGELEQVLKIAKEATWITMPGFNGHCLKADVAYSTKSWGDKKDIEWGTKE